MVKVPEPIERLFDTVPIITYPKEEIIDHIDQFYFEGENKTNDDSFKLGVHQVIPYQGSDERIRYIPNDPISLGYALWLAHKNNLKLPTKDGKGQSSNNSIIQLSYHAAPDQQLPILIEDSNESRNIISLTAVKKSDHTNIESKLITDLIDSKFIDLWILCLLNEHPNHIFKDEDEDDLFHLNKYYNSYEVANWKAFKIRYPNLFQISGTSIKTFYKSELKSFNQNLQLLSSNFINLDMSLKLKLVGYVIIFDKYLSDTEIGIIIKNYPSLIKSSYKLLEKY
ncbi:hypothetical protein DFJ63DRAFT_264196 [Scheffersomyces coipomensis]|uniref:uncharacterized protein n=1 Tax=Scheffersomyces coipomensis TaxID=1788519 RepID=UPI00315C63BC